MIKQILTKTNKDIFETILSATDQLDDYDDRYPSIIIESAYYDFAYWNMSLKTAEYMFRKYRKKLEDDAHHIFRYFNLSRIHEIGSSGYYIGNPLQLLRQLERGAYYHSELEKVRAHIDSFNDSQLQELFWNQKLECMKPFTIGEEVKEMKEQFLFTEVSKDELKDALKWVEQEFGLPFVTIPVILVRDKDFPAKWDNKHHAFIVGLSIVDFIRRTNYACPGISYASVW